MTEKKITEELEAAKENINYRTLKSIEKEILNFSSNDYLGLGADRELRNEFFETYGFLPFSSSSSRLLSGSYPLILELEEELEKIYKKKALVFNSGYEANQCIIETLFSEKSLIITDRYNHASIYSGIKSSGAKLLRFNHLDYVHLEKILKKYGEIYEDILVVSETIYSMDGDTGDLEKLIRLRDKYRFKLFIDEAHSYGVYGYGLSYETGFLDKIDFLVIPLGKAGGSAGAYLLTDSLSKNYLINKGKKFIYTTAPPPINTAWNLFILKKMESFYEQRTKLHDLSEYTRMLLKKNNILTHSDSHIISIVIGDNFKCDKISERMKEMGYNIFPIKEPTVPRGSSRLRLSLTALHTYEEIKIFIRKLKYEIN
ncbi:MAG: aminotransferase class I/II-fold pyridoxal phosphate-dependent enzyme, partial [Fusobacteriaceae bacterium]